jgi:hypothetical protein
MIAFHSRTPPDPTSTSFPVVTPMLLHLHWSHTNTATPSLYVICRPISQSNMIYRINNSSRISDLLPYMHLILLNPSRRYLYIGKAAWSHGI